MGKGAPLRWVENAFLRRHLHGTGMELGALGRPFRVAAGTRVWYVDRMAGGGLRAQYAEVATPIVNPHVVADATELPVAPGTLDFIIASHLLEHLPFPLKALQKWHEALRPGGVLLLRVPDKRFTFDARREITTLEHLVEEHDHPERFDRRRHFADWTANVMGLPVGTPRFERKLQELLDADYSIHYHVWTCDDVRRLIDYTVARWGLNWEPVVFWRAHIYRKEAVAVLKRGE